MPTENALYNQNALRSFISTDTSLTAEDLLFQYTQRWTIEVFSHQNKMDLGYLSSTQ
ncbi:hypothetical protein G9F71_003455 [Clostridium sp. FP2]|uniref:hypothetical protein n=1 Tax=Clostridium sp. FP2 TaxID=2724481 RepID=UPI0013E8F625|nr:hypothetical protein [Clostridium sp. FP2]MBZ9621912.1 hypothetical protein [Clostridium sp. FP2]